MRASAPIEQSTQSSEELGYLKEQLMTVKINPWMTIADVCEDLGVARSSLDDWRRNGRGPTFVRLPNGSLRIRTDRYAAWLETLEVV